MNVKKMLLGWLRKGVDFCSVRKTILFESAPDCSDNTKAVFDEMLRRGLNRKYDLVWVLYQNREQKIAAKNVKFIYNDDRSIWNRMKLFSVFARAKCMLCCNRFLFSVHKHQKVFFLSHATPIKYIRNYYNIPKEMSYTIGASEESSRIIAYQSRYPEDRVVSLGFPRNDVFSLSPIEIAPILGAAEEKIIAWYPTFRQHKNGRKTGSANTLPIIHDEQSAKELNRAAKELGVVLVLKPHFAQDLTCIKQMKLSNIIFIDDEFFEINHISSYQFLAACDALITDYSSVYFDFALADKPIAAIWEDIEEYKENPGLAVDLDVYMSGAERIYNLEEFVRFLDNVAKGRDVLREERRKNRDMMNISTDGRNAERVVDFICAEADL